MDHRGKTAEVVVTEDKPSFRALVGAQFLGAFNDNLFKQLMLFLAAGYLFKDRDVQGLAFAVFALPFVLFSGLAGDLSERFSKRTIIFRMNECRVQTARQRKGLSEFACKPVGLAEYTNFARTIDPRFRTRCIACPPDAHPDEYWCAWEFTLLDEEEVKLSGDLHRRAS